IQPDTGVNCDTLDLAQALEVINNPSSNVGKLGAVIECYGRSIQNVVGSLVFAPASEALIKNFQAGRPLPSTGLGGQYLLQLSNQYKALASIRRNLGSIGNAYVTFSAALRQIHLIEQRKEAQLSANSLRTLATISGGLAQAASAIAGPTAAQSTRNGPSIPFVSQAFSFGAAVGYLAQAGLEVGALQYDREVIEGGADMEVLDQQLSAIAAVEQAKNAADDVLL